MLIVSNAAVSCAFVLCSKITQKWGAITTWGILVPDDSLLSIGALVPLGIKVILFELDSRQSKPGFKSETITPNPKK